MDVEAFLGEKGRKTENALAAYFAQWKAMPSKLREAMEYSLLAGGKRLRPALTLGACELVKGDDAPAIPAACAVEMIHTYSLIHDDLPAMDDDDLRRGQPTSHKVFGEAVAILAGDALMTMAFEIAAQAGNLAVITEMAQASGVEGMAGGQMLDLQNEGKNLDLDELRRIHEWKTGALIRASVRIGAMLGGAAPHELAALTAYGESLGLAFQIADDILDVQGNEAAMGKRTGGDAAKLKSTYPAVAGVPRSQTLAADARDAAVNALAEFGPAADTLRALARYVVERDH